MNSYIIRDSQKKGLVGTIDIGTRIETSDGHVDRWWGNTKDETSLMRALQDVAYKEGMLPYELVVVDERKSAQQGLFVVQDT